MLPSSVLHDFDKLPPMAQAQVIDFIAFVKARYEHKSTNSVNKFLPTIESVADKEAKLGLGEIMLSYFKDIPPASCAEEEFVLPVREHYQPRVNFDE